MNYLLQLVEFRKRKLLRHLSANAILFYYILLEYSNEIGFPDNFTAALSTLQGKSSLSRQKIQQARSQLAEEGYITFSPGSGNQCATYWLTDLTARHEPQTEPQSGSQTDTQTGSQTGSQIGSQIGSQFGSQIGSQFGSQIGSQTVHKSGHKVITLTKQDVNETKPNKKDTLPEKESMPDFDAFWKAYPKKQAKIEAMKAFRKLSPDKELLDRMINAISLFSRSESWKHQNGRYIPLPATWLNGKRWEDEAITINQTAMSNIKKGCPY